MIANLALSLLLLSFQPNDYSRAAASIQASELRADVTYLAADELRGRATPSPGLDRAAEYIAAAFKKSGLRPLEDGSHFQIAQWKQQFRDVAGQRLSFRLGSQTWSAPASGIGVAGNFAAASGTVTDAKVRRISLSELARSTAESLAFASGHVLVVEPPGPDVTDNRTLTQAIGRAGGAAMEAGVRGVLFLDPKDQIGNYDGRDGGGPNPPAPLTRSVPVITVRDAAFCDAVMRSTDGALSWSIPDAETRDVAVRNVIGILPGSDPELAKTYVLLTAHYDHLGVRPGLDDRIYNGANDNASGVAGVMAVARAFHAAGVRPKRSLIFIAWYGEERGLQGAGFFVRQPVVPLDRIVAMVNLEQIGRTDDSEMPKVGQFEVTGFDFSDVTEALIAGGDAAGIKVVKHPRNSDAYFGASDNAAFARAGIPAHTISVAYSFPDYHLPGDHADKLDYENMEKVTRAILHGVAQLADRPTAPQWNEANPRTKPFVDAAKNRTTDPPARRLDRS